MKLIHLGPIVDHSAQERHSRIHLFRASREARRQQEIKDDLAALQAKILLHNRLTRDLPRALRARFDLLRVSLIWDDASQIATPMRGVRPEAPTYTPPSRASLREAARRNRVPLPMLWDRFPPEDLHERRLMQKELGAYYTRQAPKAAASTGDGFGKFLKQQAADAAKLAKSPDLAGRLLSDSEWKARQRATFDSLSNIDLSDIFS
jgi:hypothetical protein